MSDKLELQETCYLLARAHVGVSLTNKMSAVNNNITIIDEGVTHSVTVTTAFDVIVTRTRFLH